MTKCQTMKKFETITARKGEYKIGEVLTLDVADGTQKVKFFEFEPYLTGGTGIPSNIRYQEVPDGTLVKHLLDVPAGLKTRQVKFLVKGITRGIISDSVNLERLEQ